MKRQKTDGDFPVVWLDPLPSGTRYGFTLIPGVREMWAGRRLIYTSDPRKIN